MKKSCKWSRYFNPRSLAGATEYLPDRQVNILISIHAPSRERRAVAVSVKFTPLISIHAPSRERQRRHKPCMIQSVFQSTLPRGSDHSRQHLRLPFSDFNPRSLAGATLKKFLSFLLIIISIHAPSRERLSADFLFSLLYQFQSTLPRGSDLTAAMS